MPTWITTCARPDLYLNSVLDLKLNSLRQFNICALFLDVDCTLKNHGSRTLNAGVQDWIDSLRNEGIEMCLLSNGRRARIEKLAKQIDLPFVSLAFKPFPFGCRKAARKLGVCTRNSAIVGDQVFADVMAGKLAGLFTILVCPTSTAEPWFTRVKRPIERFVLARMACQPRSTVQATYTPQNNKPVGNNSK
ncbi:MAG: YqeG family HAD IIIA-type phosphatase [Pirellulales bacterium]|nr:YqeG family HAD IIIA-type phosphatase [Pirellulales bacterium]